MRLVADEETYRGEITNLLKGMGGEEFQWGKIRETRGGEWVKTNN